MTSSAEPSVPPEPGLPKGESEARNEICDALTELIRGVAAIADGAGESPLLDIRREGNGGHDDGSLTVRGLLRFMTTCDPDGRDGAYGELVQRTWTRVGRALVGDALTQSQIDTDRLDWLTRNGLVVEPMGRGFPTRWAVVTPDPRMRGTPHGTGDSPREAIDAARGGAP